MQVSLPDGDGRESVISVRGVVKRYGSLIALDGVDVRLDRGEVVALVGANGSGKTSLMTVLAGLRSPDGGFGQVCGVDLFAPKPQQRPSVGFAPQEVGIYPTITVAEHLSFFVSLGGVEQGTWHAEIIEVLGLGALLDRRAGELSGGERRRLHTALALLHPGTLLMFDEPTAGSDSVHRDGLLGLVRRRAEGGTGVLYSTHYLAEIEALNCRLLVLDYGRVVADEASTTFIPRYAATSVELYFDAELLPGSLSEFNAVLSRETAMVQSDDLPRTLAALLRSLGESATLPALRDLRVHAPTLDAAVEAATRQRSGRSGNAIGAAR
jgi:ABC-2 type transport system ATP-binding protein